LTLLTFLLILRTALLTLRFARLFFTAMTSPSFL
jgi:hypothetical protein